MGPQWSCGVQWDLIGFVRPKGFNIPIKSHWGNPTGSKTQSALVQLSPINNPMVLFDWDNNTAMGIPKTIYFHSNINELYWLVQNNSQDLGGILRTALHLIHRSIPPQHFSSAQHHNCRNRDSQP